MDEVSLLDLPHARARALATSGAPIYLTVNPVEFHGAHLSLHNDRLLARGMCRRIHAGLALERPTWPLVFADDLELGHEAARGLGSRYVDAPTERRLVLEAARSLAELGATRVVLMTFHGGPIHNAILDDAVRLLDRMGVAAVAPLGLALEALVHLEDPEEYRDALDLVPDPAVRARLAARLYEDFHAGFFETSMALALAPGSVGDHRAQPPCPTVSPDPKLMALSRTLVAAGRRDLAREVSLGAISAAWGMLEPFPGYTSEPAHANAAAGEAFVAHALRMMMPTIRGVFFEGRKAPPPPMAWMDLLSLGGRFFPPSPFARRPPPSPPFVTLRR